MAGSSPTKWLSLTIACPEKLSEAVTDLMGVMSGVGVNITPVQETGKQEVTGYFALENEKVEDAAAQVRQEVVSELDKLFAIYNLIPAEPVSEILDDQDWSTSWQQYFKPLEVAPGLVIKPSWEDYTPAPGQRVLEMDPGMAFGTGQHASTRLALQLLLSLFTDGSAPPKKVLDIGTGTGVLAMAAALKGADQIMAIDNDPEAVACATRNVHTNQLDWNVGVSERPLAELGSSFDLICANIVHDVLVDMAPAISRLVTLNGHVVLAGILIGEQEDNIAQVYAKHDIHRVRSEYEEEWAALLLRKS